MILNLWTGYPIYALLHMVVISDSQSALQTLADPKPKSGYGVVRDILSLLHGIAMRKGPRVSFLWVPGHSGIEGNERAHDLAQRATHQPAATLTTATLRATVTKTAQPDLERWRRDFQKATTGRYTRLLDRALPARHVKGIYDPLKRGEAQIIAQLRTGKSRLNDYLYKINAADSDQCPRCQRRETVRHFLVECRRWISEREQHLRHATRRWKDVSYLLGGWYGEREDGP